MQSRYYDPEVGRFINADAAEYSAASAIRLNDTNLFAYCGNDPINNIDSDGEFFNTIVGAVVGGILGGISAAATGESISAGVIGGAVSGALSGLGADIAIATIATGPLGVVVAVTASFALGATGSLANDAISAVRNKQTFDWEKSYKSAIVAGVNNTLSSVVSAGMSSAMDNTLNKSRKIGDIVKEIVHSPINNAKPTDIGIAVDYTVKTTAVSGLINRVLFRSKKMVR